MESQKDKEGMPARKGMGSVRPEDAVAWPDATQRPGESQPEDAMAWPDATQRSGESQLEDAMVRTDAEQGPGAGRPGGAVGSPDTAQRPVSNQPGMNMPYARQRQEPAYCRTLRQQFPFLWKICLLHGICYLLLAYRNIDGIGRGIFSAISGCCILLVAKRLKEHAVEGEDFSIAFSPESIFCLVSGVLISLSSCTTDNGTLIFFNYVGSFLLFTLACMKLFYRDQAWDFEKYFYSIFAFYMQVLEVLPVPFRDLRAQRRMAEGKKSQTKRHVLIGIVLGIPLLIIIMLLLASADKVFSGLLGNIFDVAGIFHWISEKLAYHIVLLPWSFFVYSILLYAVFAALCKKELKEEVKQPSRYGDAIAITIFSMLDVVYVIFSGIQFLFLFGGLPSGVEYAAYARQGFFQLLFVALINFVLVMVCNKHFEKCTPLKAVMTVTCLCTFVMIVSSAYRMFMYIRVYHLTFLRVSVLWFLLVLTFFMAGCMVSIYRRGWNSFRYCLLAFTCFYTVYALSGVQGRIAAYNVSQFEKALVQYQNGEKEKCPALVNYLPDDYMASKEYAAALSGIRGKYQELGAENEELIDDYLNVRNHFYHYDYWDDDIEEYDEDYDEEEYMEDDFDKVFDGDAAIYDRDIPNSLLLWKHFNFAEYACYQKCNP